MADHRNRAAGLGTAGGALAFCMARLLLAQTAPPVDFQREIRPILSDNCFQCHGPDGASRQAGLRLDRRESALEARPDGAPIVPGKSAESLLYQRISRADASFRMPPADSHKTAHAGANRDHQALDRRRRSVERTLGVPGARQAERCPRSRMPRGCATPSTASSWRSSKRTGSRRRRRRSPHPDSPRRARHHRPSAQARRSRSLSRRTLLPTPTSAWWIATWPRPTMANIARATGWTPRAMATPTASTSTITAKSGRYRDWVIAAFNRNLPFDQFTIEQLAGDLLPNPTLDQRIATGFLRCGDTTNEAGIIEDEYAEIYAKDRADTVGAVWLGHDGGLRHLPRSQVRPDSAEGFLRARRLLPQYHAEDHGRQPLRHAARSCSCRAPQTAPRGSRRTRA